MQNVANNKKRVGILRGGAGRNYDKSLRSGGDIILHIAEKLGDKYKTFDILIDRDGAWHLNGVPIQAGDLENKIDIAWNTTHENFSNVFDNLAIPHVKTGVFASSLANSRELLSEHMKNSGVPMPRHFVIPLYQKDFDGPREKYASKKARAVLEKFSSPWIVKTFTPDASMGIHLAKTFPELVSAIEDAVNHEKSILVEEFISGKVASVHSVQGFRGEDIYHFPLGKTFDNLSTEEKEGLFSIAREIYRNIGVEHYLKADFLIDKRGKVYLLNIDLSPDFRAGSHFREVCEMVAAEPHHVIEHIIQTKL